MLSRWARRGCSATALAGIGPVPVVQRVHRSSPSARSRARISSEICAAAAVTSPFVRGGGELWATRRPEAEGAGEGAEAACPQPRARSNRTRSGTRVHSHRTGAPASNLRYVAPVPATSDMARARSALARRLRDALEARGYLEVETPIAVPFAGQEPHLRPFETAFTPDPPVPAEGVQGARRLHLHTSPEHAMKRLLARDGFSRCYQLARVFRDGEVSPAHNPEFTLLEFYAAPGSAETIMADLEQIVFACASEAPARKGHGRGSGSISLRPPFERLTCRDAFVRYAGFDPLPLDAEALAQAARAGGLHPAPGASWDDLFTQVLLERVEPALGIERPTFLTEYPASQAAL